MGLPIAIGSKSVSRISLATYVRQSDDATTHSSTSLQSIPGCQPIPVQPGSPQLPSPLIACALSSPLGVSGIDSKQPRLQAIVSLYYFSTTPPATSALSSPSKHSHNNNPSAVPKVAAEFRIQIAPAADPFSSSCRETIYQVYLPITILNSQQSEVMVRFPDNRAQKLFQAHFTADGRALICIVPLPRVGTGVSSSAASSLNTWTLVFPLRRPRSNSVSSKDPAPPLPTYLSLMPPASSIDERDPHDNPPIPVAAKPMFVQDDDGGESSSASSQQSRRPLTKVTSVCNISLGNQQSFMLVGDSQGIIRAITMNPLQASMPLIDPKQESGQSLTNSNGSNQSYSGKNNNKPSVNGIESIHAVTEGVLEGLYWGTLAVLDDQQRLHFWKWNLAREPTGREQVNPEVPLMMGGGSMGSLWFLSLQSSTWRLPDDLLYSAVEWVTPWNLVSMTRGSSCTLRVWGWAADGHPVVRSEMTLRQSDILESADATFHLPGIQKRENEETVIPTYLENDPTTGSLLISSSFQQSTTTVCPFTVIWNWRFNVRGLMIHQAADDSLGRSSTCCHVLSRLFLANSSNDGHQKLVHVLASPSASECCIQKDIYETGVLSPRCRLYNHYRPITPEVPLLLTNESVSYPCASRLTVIGDYQLEWKDAMIPLDYRLRGNTPSLSCIGKRGLSIAVAGREGFCTLSCPPTTITPSVRRRARWHRFANDSSERAFRVLAMAWWEGREATQEYMAEDLLVAVIAVPETNGQTSHYLSCWSPSRLDLNHQLFIEIQSPVAAGQASDWGLRLSDDVTTMSLDILEEPSEHLESSPFRKAIMLLSNDSHTKEFMVFQVQLVRRSQSVALTYSEKQPCAALIRCVGEYELGSPADLFLAGGSFAFDLLAARRGTQLEDSLDFIATVGVVRRGAVGFDAMALSASTISAIGSIPLSDSVHSPAEVSSYWLSDIAEKLSTFVWTLQLSDGSLLCWSVPFAQNLAQHRMLVQSSAKGAMAAHFGSQTPVHSHSLLLGIHCTTGSTDMWMQVSTLATKTELALGPLPGSAFGCVLGSGQACRKLYRGEDFDKKVFGPDFANFDLFGPSNFVLYPPAVVTALYMFLKNASMSSFLQVQDHLRWRLKLYPFSDSVMISLQLLALRSVEMYASSSKRSEESNRSHRVLLESVTNLVRNLTSPLKFSSFFLEIGRQLEPSCFNYLFPLPDPRIQQLTELIDSILDHGCLEIAVAALPLLEDSKHSTSLCTFILNHCLRKISLPNHSFPSEEIRIVPDVFRYGLKLADPNDEIVTPTTYDDEILPPREILPGDNMKDEAISPPYSYDDDDSENDADLSRPASSLFCGIGRMFEPTNKKANVEMKVAEAATSFIEHNFEDDGFINQTEEGGSSHDNASESSSSTSPTASGVVARHLLDPIFTKGKPQWNEVSRIAEAVLGNKQSTLQSCSEDHFLRLLKQTTIKSYESWVSNGSSAQEEVDRFLRQNLRSCMKMGESLTPVYDLVFTLLAYEKVCEDMDVEVPGLLLIALITGHVLDRLPVFEDLALITRKFFLVKRYTEAVRHCFHD